MCSWAAESDVDSFDIGLFDRRARLYFLRLIVSAHWHQPCLCLVVELRLAMLKISILDTSAPRRIVLEGKLIAPWVTELNQTWKALAADLGGREFVVDIGDVTVISREGENALLELMRHGAKFQCRGVFARHIVEQLTRRHKSQGRNYFPRDAGDSKEAKDQE